MKVLFGLKRRTLPKRVSVNRPKLENFPLSRKKAMKTMCSGLFLEKIFFVGLFKLSGKLPSPDQNDTYVPPSFSSSCKLSKILFQFVEKKLQFKTISSIMCCIKQSVYDCFKDINFWSAARLAEIYNGGTGVSASRRPGL